MTSIITRSALVAWGRNPPPEVAYIVADHRGRRVVTWAEVLEMRRERQRVILDRKRETWPRAPRPYKLWVAFYDMDLFGGWHAFLENRRERVWIDRDRKWLIPVLMEVYPLVLNFGVGAWEEWKVEFARQFQRRRHHRQPLGVDYVWWDGHDRPRRCAQRSHV